MRRDRPTLVVLALMFLPGCPPGSTPVAQPSGGATATGSFDRSLPEERHLAPLSGNGRCTAGSNVDFDRMVKGTATSTLGDLGPTMVLPASVQDLGVTVPDGTYTWSNRPLNLDCFPTGPTAGPFTVDFTFTYRAWVDRSNTPDVCVFRSRADFGSFTGVSPIDDVIRDKVQDQAHRGVDLVVADQLNRLTYSNRPFPDGADPRCPDWAELPR